MNDLVYDKSVDVPVDEIDGVLGQCLTCWQNLLGKRRAPTWWEFSIMELPARVIPFFAIVDIEPDSLEFRYRLWGSGETVSGHPQGRGDAVTAEYLRVIDVWCPLAFRRNIRLPEPRPTITQLTLRLPLSAPGEQVDHILSISDL